MGGGCLFHLYMLRLRYMLRVHPNSNAQYQDEMQAKDYIQLSYTWIEAIQVNGLKLVRSINFHRFTLGIT